MSSCREWKYFKFLHGETQVYNFYWTTFQFNEKHVIVGIFHTESVWNLAIGYSELYFNQ